MFRLDSSDIFVWFPVITILWTLLSTLSFFWFMVRFGKNPLLRSVVTYLFIAANLVSIILVGKIWEAEDQVVLLSNVKQLTLGIILLCLSYLCPFGVSPIVIKALFPKLWQAARSMNSGDRSVNNLEVTPIPPGTKIEAHALTANQRTRFTILFVSYVVCLALWTFIIFSHKNDEFLLALGIIIAIFGMICLAVVYHLMRHSPPR